MRLFLAIDPDERARATLADVLAHAAEALGPAASALRWMTPDSVHLTLHFLGDVASDRARLLIDALKPRAAAAPFRISLDRFGAFPPSGPPRTIWLGLGAGTEDVNAVHAELGRRLTALGFASESRPFSPHLTVARVRDQHRSRVQGIRGALASIRLPPLEWTVSRALLYESDLSGPRPRYTEVGHLELEGETRL